MCSGVERGTWLGAAGQHRPVPRVPPNHSRDPPGRAELRNLLQHRVGDGGGQQDLLRVGRVKLGCNSCGGLTCG